MYIDKTKVTAGKINREIQAALAYQVTELILASDLSTAPKLQKEIQALISRGADVNKITLSGCKWINTPSHLYLSLTFLLNSGWQPNHCLKYILKNCVSIKVFESKIINSEEHLKNILKTLVSLAYARGANLEEMQLESHDIAVLPLEVVKILLEYDLAPQALILYLFFDPKTPDVLKAMDLAIQKGVLIPPLILGDIPDNYLGIEILRLIMKHSNLRVDQKFSVDFVIDEISKLGPIFKDLKDAFVEMQAVRTYKLDEEFAYNGTFCHLWAKRGKTELLKYTIDEKLCSVNMLNDKGQNALFFASNPKIVELLLSEGADTSIRDLEGNTWLSAPSVEIAEYILHRGLLDQDKQEAMFKDYLTKGNFENARKFFQAGIRASIDPLEYVIEAIDKGITSSVEPNKYHALVDLMHRAGIAIPLQFHHLIHNVSDTISNEEFRFTRGLIPRLAKHYIDVAKYKFIKEWLRECAMAPRVHILIDQAFVASAHNRYEAFKALKKVCPGSQTLKRVESEFDAIFMVVGMALIYLDNDFAWNVLTLNGLPMPPLPQHIDVYRGLRAYADENEIVGWFKYGIRAFSMGGKVQNFLGYYVQQPWNVALGRVGVALGRTCVTLEPIRAATCAADPTKGLEKESILVHIILSKGSPRICGSYKFDYELVPSSILGEEIVAVYKLKIEDWGQYLVTEAHYNPFLTNITQKYKPGDYVRQDPKQIEVYNNLGCQELSVDETEDAFDVYANYDDFILRYAPQHSEAQAELDRYFSDRPLVEAEFDHLSGCDPASSCC